MSQSFGYCRGCGKQILWTKTPNGKAMPCDPLVIRFTPEGGPDTFITPEGKTVRGRQNPKSSLIGYVPHWVTCPERDRFRKEKRA